MSEGFLLKTDGGSRGNPGEAGIGFELLHDGVPVAGGGACIGIATNNVAEYRALIWGLDNARAAGATVLRVEADSKLVIEQMKGAWKVKHQDMKPLYDQAQGQCRHFTHITFTHIPREKNKVADAFVNEALDVQATVGTPLCSLDDSAPLTLFDTPSYERKSPVMNGTYRLTVKDHFDAAHRLYEYPGQCANLHGHTWDVEVTIASKQLDDIGIVYDFKDIKRDLHTVLDSFDHTYINEHAPFDELSPTAENLARIVCERLTPTLPDHVAIEEVAVWESPIARVGFTPER